MKIPKVVVNEIHRLHCVAEPPPQLWTLTSTNGCLNILLVEITITLAKHQQRSLPCIVVWSMLNLPALHQDTQRSALIVAITLVSIRQTYCYRNQTRRPLNMILPRINQEMNNHTL
jgi:hypothetical protein